MDPARAEPLITGATGSGKTWIACALAQQSCRQGHSVLYFRVPRLLEELRIAHGDGSYIRFLKTPLQGRPHRAR